MTMMSEIDRLVAEGFSRRRTMLRDADITFYRPEISSSKNVAFPFLVEAIRSHPLSQQRREITDHYSVMELKKAGFTEQSRLGFHGGKRVMTATEVLEKRVEHGEDPEVRRFLRELPYMTMHDVQTFSSRPLAPNQCVLPASVYETMCQDEALRWFTQLHTRSAIRVKNYIQWHRETFHGDSFPPRISPTPASALVLFIPDCYTLAKLAQVDMPFDAQQGSFSPDAEYKEKEAGIFRSFTTDAYEYLIATPLYQTSGLKELFGRQWEYANWLTHNGSLMEAYRGLLREIDPLRKTATTQSGYYKIPAFLTKGITPLVLGGVPSPLQSAFSLTEIVDPETDIAYLVTYAPDVKLRGIDCGVRYPGSLYHQLHSAPVTFATMFCGDARLSTVATIPDARHGEIRPGMPEVR